MITLSLAEQETHLSTTAEDRSVWEIYSDDPVMQKKFEKIGATLIRQTADGIGKIYSLPSNQISFKKPPKPLTEAQKAHLANIGYRKSE